MKKTTAGSMSPERVPIASPSSGVRPMEVSTDSPFLMAQTEAPLPRWQLMMLSSDSGLPSALAVSSAMKRWEVPWAP
ncbi:hypothetical protein D3C80_1152090 [compost metagenome]